VEGKGESQKMGKKKVPVSQKLIRLFILALIL
jgi:hypothetical protein